MCMTCMYVICMISCTGRETGAFDSTTVTLWSPVARSDIAWNFEKFLIDGEGNMVQRYHRYFLVGDIEKDIDGLM